MAKLKYQLSRPLKRFKESSLGNTLYHSKNYLIGDVSIKALALISMPVFTRLMSKEDYGIVAVYSATIGVLVITTSLNATDGISRYYYEKEKNDFGKFLSSIVQLIVLIQLPTVLILFLFKEQLLNALGLPTDLIYFIVIGLFYGISQKVFRQILISRKMSSKYVITNVANGYGSFGLSWLLLCLATGYPYLLRVLGFSIAQFFTAVWMMVQSWSYIIWSKMKWEHLRYSLHFALPRLPYVLSGVILSQFDRVMLGGMHSPSEAGVYSVGYNVGGLSLLIIGAITPALLPNFYQLMNEGKYKDVDRLNTYLFWIIIAGGTVLMLIGGELLKFLAEGSFHQGASVVPAVVLGYMFFALAGVYNRYSGYYKVTIVQSIGALAAGGLNILLNYLWIPEYGMMAAAYATAISYAAQAVITWGVLTLVIKEHVSSLRLFILPTIIVIVVFTCLYAYGWF